MFAWALRYTGIAYLNFKNCAVQHNLSLRRCAALDAAIFHNLCLRALLGRMRRVVAISPTMRCVALCEPSIVRDCVGIAALICGCSGPFTAHCAHALSGVRVGAAVQAGKGLARQRAQQIAA